MPRACSSQGHDRVTKRESVFRRRGVMSYLRPAQDSELITSVMLAHCVSAGVPIGRVQDYGIMPTCEGWNRIAYEWQDKCLDKLVRDLVLHGLWDSLELCCEVVCACMRACVRACACVHA